MPAAQAHGMIYARSSGSRLMLAFIDNFKMLGVIFLR